MAHESWTCQGFPVDKELSYGVPCCSWAMRAEASHSQVPRPSRNVAIGQAGNSMHTEVACSMITYALSEIVIDRNARCMFKLSIPRSVGNLPLPDCDLAENDASLLTQMTSNSELSTRWATKRGCKRARSVDSA